MKVTYNNIKNKIVKPYARLSTVHAYPQYPAQKKTPKNPMWPWPLTVHSISDTDFDCKYLWNESSNRQVETALSTTIFPMFDDNNLVNIGPRSKNDLNLWPMTFKFNRVLEVAGVHIHAKFHRAECSGSWVIVVTEKNNLDENKMSVATTDSNKKLPCGTVMWLYMYCKWKIQLLENYANISIVCRLVARLSKIYDHKMQNIFLMYTVVKLLYQRYWLIVTTDYAKQTIHLIWWHRLVLLKTSLHVKQLLTARNSHQGSQP